MELSVQISPAYLGLIPFEATVSSFLEARKTKVEKYIPLGLWLESERQLDMCVHAFVVGALGAWDPEAGHIENPKRRQETPQETVFRTQ